MRDVPGKLADPTRFKSFEPIEVLYEFDGPRIFTILDADDELNLVYWSDEDALASRFVVVPTTSGAVASLRRGEASVFDALNQPRCWLCDVSHAGEIVKCVRAEFADLPRDSLPATGAMLLPALEPHHVNLEGRIRELDKDRLSFELREIDDRPHVQRFVFEKELFDDVFHAFQRDVRVRVSGRTFPVQNVSVALALTRPADAPSAASP